MKNYIVAFDIDGTLIQNANQEVFEERRYIGGPYKYDAPNVRVMEFLVLCSKIFKNVKVLVWSAGGKDYATSWVERTGINKYVWRCAGKNEAEELNKEYNIIAIDDIHRADLGGIANLIVRMK